MQGTEDGTYRIKTRETYNRYAAALSRKYEARSETQLQEILDFLAQLPGKRVIDIGSGPGAQAKMMEAHGAAVLCIDISEEMVGRCREKGLRAAVLDLTDLTALRDESFDGVWAYASLLHVKRAALPHVFQEFSRILSPGGILAVAVQRGEGEEFRTNDPQHPGAGRWFTYFPHGEIPRRVAPYFSLVSESFDPFHDQESDRIATGWDHYLFQKTPE